MWQPRKAIFTVAIISIAGILEGSRAASKPKPAAKTVRRFIRVEIAIYPFSHDARCSQHGPMTFPAGFLAPQV